jgi:hypothetical protein
LRITHRRCLFEPFAGDLEIVPHAIALVVDRAHAVHGGGIVERDALFEQAVAFGIIAMIAPFPGQAAEIITLKK